MRTMGSTLVGKHENKINFECTQMNDMCIQRKRIIYVVNMLIGLTLLPLSNLIRSLFCICWDRRYFLNYFTVLLYSLNPKKKAVFFNRVKVDEGEGKRHKSLVVWFVLVRLMWVHSCQSVSLSDVCIYTKTLLALLMCKRG